MGSEDETRRVTMTMNVGLEEFAAQRAWLTQHSGIDEAEGLMSLCDAIADEVRETGGNQRYAVALIFEVDAISKEAAEDESASIAREVHELAGYEAMYGSPARLLPRDLEHDAGYHYQGTVPELSIVSLP